MLDSNMFKPFSFQIALFFGPDFNLQPLAIATLIKDKLGSMFSVEPSTIPYPPNAPIPLEAPKVILQGDSNGQIIVSSLRADLILNLKSEVSLEQKLSDFVCDFADCFENAKIVRLGCIIQFDMEKDAIEVIRENYIKEGKLVDAKELYVGWLKKMKIVNLDSNRIVNFASNSMNGSICGRLMVDSNTVPENMLDLKGNDIKEYVAACILQAKGDFNVFVE